jgi:hypothetical protein
VDWGRSTPLWVRQLDSHLDHVWDRSWLVSHRAVGLQCFGPGRRHRWSWRRLLLYKHHNTQCGEFWGPRQYDHIGAVPYKFQRWPQEHASAYRTQPNNWKESDNWAGRVRVVEGNKAAGNCGKAFTKDLFDKVLLVICMPLNLSVRMSEAKQTWTDHGSLQEPILLGDRYRGAHHAIQRSLGWEGATCQ